MSGDARNIDDCPRALLLHDWDHRLHAFDGPEKIGVEQLAEIGHLHAGDRIQQSVAGVVDPDIDVVEVMHGEADDAVDFFAMTYIARQSQSLLRMSNARARSFRAPGIAGKHHRLRSLLDEKLGDRLANSHGRTRNYRNLARKFHAGFVS